MAGVKYAMFDVKIHAREDLGDLEHLRARIDRALRADFAGDIELDSDLEVELVESAGSPAPAGTSGGGGFVPIWSIGVKKDF